MIFDEELLKQQAKINSLKKQQDGKEILKQMNSPKFRREMGKRLGSLKSCAIPDFGIAHQHNLFDEMMHSNFQVDENGLHQIAVQRNLWMVFFDAIKIYPKFQKLKNMINKSNDEKNSIEQLLAREALEKYLMQKRLQEQMAREQAEKKKKKVKIDTGETTQNTLEQKEEGVNVQDEVEDLLKDHEKLASIQKMLN